MPKTKPVAVLKVSGKTSDLCSLQFADKDGGIIATSSGYVPDFFPGHHCGDYLELNIEVETGKILNWKPPSQLALRNYMEEHGE